MLIFIKKGNLFLLAGILFLSVLGVGLALRRSEKIHEVMAVPGFGKRIILDAGHGEPDGGAEGPDGVLEKDLNLSIVRFLQEYLEQSGVEVWLTRSDDAGIYDVGSQTIRQKKRSDLHNRQTIMNDSDADVFVSIHMNKFEEAKYSGPQVFYSGQQEESKPLAQCLQQSLISVLKPVSERTIKKAGKDIYLLSHASVPAVLIECGFLSNAQEAALLQTEAYQKKVAWAIYCGLVQYFAEF